MKEWQEKENRLVLNESSSLKSPKLVNRILCFYKETFMQPGVTLRKNYVIDETN